MTVQRMKAGRFSVSTRKIRECELGSTRKTRASQLVLISRKASVADLVAELSGHQVGAEIS